MINIKILFIAVAYVLLSYIISKIFTRYIFPKIAERNMIEICRNPKWFVSRLSGYYGFQDIDFVLAKSKYGMLPRFRLGETKKLELWIPYDIETRCVEELAKLALIGKLHIKYKVSYPNKSLQWLSTLCFMLDGNDANITFTSEKRE